MRGVRGVVGDHLIARGYACGLACALFLSALLALSAQARGGETTLPYDIAADLDQTSRCIGPLAFAPAAPTVAGREARWRAETAMISAVAKWMSRAPDFPDYSLAIRLHHRSNAYIFEGDGSLQYLLVGLRANF